MEREQKINEIMGIVRGIKPLDSRLPVFQMDEAGNLIQTGEFLQFAPIEGGIIVKCQLTDKDIQEIEDIKAGRN